MKPHMMTAELLTALAQGRVTFDHFVAEATVDMTRLARHIVTRWGGLPPGLDVDDLVQEMLLAVYQQLPSYRPRSGTDIKSFVVFRVCACARRELRRFAARAQVEQRCIDLAQVHEPDQEVARLARELTELVPFDDRQRTIMGSLARTGSLDATTSELLAHPDTATMFANPNPARAKHSVYRTALKLAHRAQAMTA